MPPRLRTSEQSEKKDLLPEPSPHNFFEKLGYPLKIKKEVTPEHIPHSYDMPDVKLLV